MFIEGKTKNIRSAKDHEFIMEFKDSVTGIAGVVDPGGNEVAGTVEGMGKSNLKVSTFFFKAMEEAGIPTHFISSNIEENTMTVEECKVFGKGLEVITRFFAKGSFVRRYGDLVEDEQDLGYYMEITTKDDERGDPLITEDALLILNILTEEELEKLKELNKKASIEIRRILEEKDLTLIDLKLEFGYSKKSEKIVIMDEISSGNMRVFKDGKSVKPLELQNYLEIS